MATYKQRKTLGRFTGLDWSTVSTGVDKKGSCVPLTVQVASRMIRHAIGIYIYHKSEHLQEFVNDVQMFFSDFEFNQTRKRTKTAKRSKGSDNSSAQEDRTEPEPEPEPREESEDSPYEESKSEAAPDNSAQEQQEQKEKAGNQNAQGNDEKQSKEESEETDKKESNEEESESDESAPEPDYILPDEYGLVKKLIKNKVNVLLSGPAGCGKTRMVREIARTLGKEFFTISFAGGLRYAQVFGSTHLVGGSSAWVPGPLLQAVQKPGVVLIDEIFGAESDVSLGLNGMLEPDTRSVLTPIGEIKVHPECAIVACANTIGRSANKQYTGAQRTDDSLLDRFVLVTMTYSKKVEIAIAEKMVTKQETRERILSWVWELRVKISAENIAFDPSTRRMINTFKLVNFKVPVKVALELTFLNSLTKAERSTLGYGG